MSEYIIPAAIISYAAAYYILRYYGYFVKRGIPQFECRKGEYKGLKIGVERGNHAVNIYAYGELDGKKVLFTRQFDRFLMRKTPKPVIEIMSDRLKRKYGVNLPKDDSELIGVFEKLYEELELSK